MNHECQNNKWFVGCRLHVSLIKLHWSRCIWADLLQPWITLFHKEIQHLIKDVKSGAIRQYFVWNVIVTQRLMFFDDEPLPPAARSLIATSIFSAVREISSTHQRLQHLRNTTKWWVYTLISQLNSALICSSILSFCAAQILKSIVAMPLLEDENEDELCVIHMATFLICETKNGLAYIFCTANYTSTWFCYYYCF